MKIGKEIITFEDIKIEKNKFYPNKTPSFLKDVDTNPLRANFTKWSNTLKQFIVKLPTNCLSVFDHFVKLALKGLRKY